MDDLKRAEVELHARSDFGERLATVRKEDRLPEVLSPEEVVGAGDPASGDRLRRRLRRRSRRRLRR
ncbi:MAG TPA: hypothetical protein VHX64_16285 [Caulobacteraceae bacterium]|nr:hypothetical protein [Caulobacteraceae bacterium]